MEQLNEQKSKWLIKIGGSLGKAKASDGGAPLPLFLEAIEKLASAHLIVILPGGGEYADFIRISSHSKDIDKKTAHAQALAAMAQFGHEIDAHLSTGKIAHNVREIERIWENGKIPLFIPYPCMLHDKTIIKGWHSTSDTFAARSAQLMSIKNVALIKCVDGITENGNLLTQVNASAMPTNDVVDPEFANHLAPGSCAHIINGNHPERLYDLLTGGDYMGTKIIKNRSADHCAH